MLFAFIFQYYFESFLIPYLFHLVHHSTCSLYVLNTIILLLNEIFFFNHFYVFFLMALLHFHYHLFKLIRVSSEFIFVINAMKYLLSTTRAFTHSFLTFYLSCQIDYLKDTRFE